MVDPEQLELDTLQKDVQRLQQMLHSEQSNWQIKNMGQKTQLKKLTAEVKE